VHIGHINLAKSFNGAGEHFVNLVEALQQHGVQQYVLVRNVALAKRLDLVGGVTAGPVVRSAVMAYCLMPSVDVVHIHDPAEGQSGLLLTLTRSIPVVLTHRDESPGKNPLIQAVYRRASGIIYQCDADATKHLRIYKRAVESWRSATALKS
jgi:voltage-gated potassium channel Kch